jgi:hypothetical protein
MPVSKIGKQLNGKKKRLMRELNRPIKKMKGFSPLVNVILSISIALFGAFFTYWLNTSSDFVVSIKPMAISGVENDNISEDCQLFIDNANKINPYIHSVALDVSSYNGSMMPPNLRVIFHPQGNSSIPFHPKLTVEGSNMKVGTYKLKITALGGDGKERSCPLILVVTKY